MAVDGIVVNVISGNNPAGVSVLKVSGYLDTTTASELEAALYGLLDREIYRVVVDLSGVNYISSAGWGIFIGEIKRIRSHGGDLKLAHVPPSVESVLRLTRLNSVFDLHPAMEDALKAFPEG